MPAQVSIVLPVRNAATFLEEALASTLNEDLGLAVELLAVDDHSTDDTSAILAGWARRDRRVQVHRTEGTGLVAALNHGLELATAPIVVRMDADDRSLPGRIARLHDCLRADPQIAVVGTRVALHPDGRSGGGMQRYVAWLNQLPGADLGSHRWIESPLAHPTVAFRTDLVRRLGGYRSGPFPEDYDLWLRLAAAGQRLARLDEVLYLWRDHPERATWQDPRYSPEAFRRLKVEDLRTGALSGHAQVWVWGAGKTGRPFARCLRAAGFEVAAWIEVDPRKIGRLLHGAPVLGMDGLDRRPRLPLVVAVGAAGARELIREELARRGWREPEDYLVVA